MNPAEKMVSRSKNPNFAFECQSPEGDSDIKMKCLPIISSFCASTMSSSDRRAASMHVHVSCWKAFPLFEKVVSPPRIAFVKCSTIGRSVRIIDFPKLVACAFPDFLLLDDPIPDKEWYTEICSIVDLSSTTVG